MARPEPTPPEGTDLPAIRMPKRYGYIAAFLTLNCNLNCSYCINWHNGPGSRHRRQMNAAEWLRGLNRILSPPDLPVTLQGGEPTLHGGFLDIINGLRGELTIDILTNAQFDVERFVAAVPTQRLRRDAPYASIRVSYHPETMDLADTKRRVLRLLEGGYSVGIWAVEHPAWAEAVGRAREECLAAGIDFRVKEFLGEHDGRTYGTYKYPEAVAGRRAGRPRPVECRTSELIIGPSGHVYRCHSDCYADRGPIGHILDPSFDVEDIYRPCENFGLCNPCDIKVKTNRFQQYGHTSVEIRFPPGGGQDILLP
jgi:hypothetical protein